MATDWNTCNPQTAPISLGTHSLSLSVAGPSRASGTPAIIVIQGIASSTAEWTPCIRSLSAFARVFSYDRSGFGKSDVSPNDPSAENIALELHELLKVAGVEGPFVLVAHSYGGIIAREFIPLRPQGDVVGVVFVDANTEETPGTYPNPAVQALGKGLNGLEVTIGDSHVLGTGEWDVLMREEDSERGVVAGRRELEFYHASGRSLAAKKQVELDPPLLGDAPIVVLHANYALDLQKIYDAGVAAGNGSEEERETMREFIAEANALEERMQRKTLGLSRRSRWEFVEGSGHYVHMLNRLLKYSNQLTQSKANIPNAAPPKIGAPVTIALAAPADDEEDEELWAAALPELVLDAAPPAVMLILVVIPLLLIPSLLSVVSASLLLAVAEAAPVAAPDTAVKGVAVPAEQVVTPAMLLKD
ncbi:hypothetical protein PRZ48_008610 [Zasmidium cellare]|uniref:AB hydrolase-1 domain-containing protein n=1 Tax=Zasmidium cellare TaxID=395010 RepID=A0ABR0EGR0_ZASCE|nr:hypothetical protein PRZ48_008610 [Zasmidium cellare]